VPKVVKVAEVPEVAEVENRYAIEVIKKVLACFYFEKRLLLCFMVVKSASNSLHSLYPASTSPSSTTAVSFTISNQC